MNDSGCIEMSWAHIAQLISRLGLRVHFRPWLGFGDRHGSGLVRLLVWVLLVLAHYAWLVPQDALVMRVFGHTNTIARFMDAAAVNAAAWEQLEVFRGSGLDLSSIEHVPLRPRLPVMIIS